MENKITPVAFTTEAANVITALQHKNGTYEYYQNTLARIYSTVLHESEEMGMSDTETVRTLRVIDSIRRDLEALRHGVAIPGNLPLDEIPERAPLDAVSDTFDGFDIDEPNTDPDHDAGTAGADD